jgi:hypothetical protein
MNVNGDRLIGMLRIAYLIDNLVASLADDTKDVELATIQAGQPWQGRLRRAMGAAVCALPPGTGGMRLPSPSRILPGSHVDTPQHVDSSMVHTPCVVVSGRCNAQTDSQGDWMREDGAACRHDDGRCSVVEARGTLHMIPNRERK